MGVTKFEFDYRMHEPKAPLGRLVESVWYARGTVPYARERIAPTGSTVAVFVLGDPIVETPAEGQPLRTDFGFLVGPHDRPVWNAPTGETYAMGIVTTPVGCEAVFGRLPSSLRGKVVPLADAWPASAEIRRELLAAADSEDKLGRLVAHLEAIVVPNSTGFARCEQAVALLGADPKRPIAEIADELQISHAHLDRQFTAWVGLGPRVLARLLRLRRMLERFDVQAPPDWAALASEYGWYDQAHFIRDFRRHTGVTPSEYVAAQRAAYAPESPGEGAGFVPDV